MTLTIRARGLKTAQKELDKALKDVKFESEEMLTVMLMSISANTAPYVPVDTATLINSERRSVVNQGGRIVGEISYGADGSINPRGTPVQDYAVMVHDGPQKRWQKPGASNQFLRKGVRDFIQDDLSRIIARYKP